MTPTASQPLNNHRFLFWLSLYVGIHFLVRLAMGGTLELDEAEQIVLAQGLAAGYTTQPPLYTWLQWGVFQIFGHGVLGLAILKAGLIFSIYFFVWQIARRLISSYQMALLAAFGLILIPSVSWESIRDLTHSVLATAIAAATFFAVIRIYEDRSALAYLLLGGLLAAGMLSKYSFAVFVLSLLLAALSLPAWRGLLFDKRILLTVFAGTVVALPHLIWAIGHLNEIREFIGQQVHAESDGGFVSGVIAGLGSLAKNIAEFVLLLVLVVSLIFPRLYRRRSDAANDHYLLVERFLLAALVVCLGLILFMGTTQFQSRWFQPLLILLPVYLLARADTEALSGRRKAIFSGVLLLFAGIIIVLRFGQFWLAPYMSDRPNRMQLPSMAIAEQVRQAGFESGTIISADNLEGGNLKLYFPDSRVLTARTEFFNAALSHQSGQCLIVWKATKHTAMPKRLRQYLKTRGLADLADQSIQYPEAPYQYLPFASYKLGMILLEDGSGCNTQ